ncbi:hypothetical protein K435DRAFT_860635 [Dendrothele bispora CBS 962.96]|uniref:Uncharacterized protein n=1 Tax=Dendrothele bispora (strain CBS 962.96) TaxID=1314807 RepID=A0A4S8LXU7_DENBC|nr:hypothetical protein K435DRAFT_860635 [Dendrothele bispora CBS 962.96]
MSLLLSLNLEDGDILHQIIVQAQNLSAEEEEVRSLFLQAWERAHDEANLVEWDRSLQSPQEQTAYPSPEPSPSKVSRSAPCEYVTTGDLNDDLVDDDLVNPNDDLVDPNDDLVAPNDEFVWGTNPGKRKRPGTEEGAQKRQRFLLEGSISPDVIEGDGHHGGKEAHRKRKECSRGGGKMKKSRKQKSGQEAESERSEGEPSHETDSSDFPFVVLDTPHPPPKIPLEQAEDFILRLTSGCKANILHRECQEWINTFKSFFFSPSWTEVLSLPRDSDSAASSFALRCLTVEKKDAQSSLHRMLAELFLAAQVNSILVQQNTGNGMGMPTGRASSSQAINQILNENRDIPDLSEKRIRVWWAIGSRWALLAASGGIFMILVVAALELRRYCLKGISIQGLRTFGDLLRQPNTFKDKAPWGCALLQSELVPLLVLLRRELPLQMPTFFPAAFRGSYRIPELLICRNFVDSDCFFDAFTQHLSLLIPRDPLFWNAHLEDLPAVPTVCLNQANLKFLRADAEILTPHSPTTLNDKEETATANADCDSVASAHVERNLVTFTNDCIEVEKGFYKINTSFDINHPSYAKLPFSDRSKGENRGEDGAQNETGSSETGGKSKGAQGRGKGRKESREEWTEKQRLKARAAKAPQNWEGPGGMVEELIAHFDSTGKVGNRKPWLKVSRQFIENQEIQVNGKEGELLFFVAGNMPQNLKANLFAKLCLALRKFSPEDQFSRTTAYDTEGKVFPALHFTFYSRYGPSGEGAPTDVHPSYLGVERGQSRKGAVRINYGQILTRESNDMRDNPEEFSQVCDALAEMMEWAVSKADERNPGLFEGVKGTVDIFPSNATTPFHPFSSFVVNVNVKTKGHRDSGDQSACMVVVVGEHEGGELCLFESRLVLETAHSDLIVFDSRKLTHFNLSFKGYRGSLVFHSDRRGERYQRDGNGWDLNNYVR